MVADGRKGRRKCWMPRRKSMAAEQRTAEGCCRLRAMAKTEDACVCRLHPTAQEEIRAPRRAALAAIGGERRGGGGGRKAERERGSKGQTREEQSKPRKRRQGKGKRGKGGQRERKRRRGKREHPGTTTETTTEAPKATTHPPRPSLDEVLRRD